MSLLRPTRGGVEFDPVRALGLFGRNGCTGPRLYPIGQTMRSWRRENTASEAQIEALVDWLVLFNYLKLYVVQLAVTVNNGPHCEY